MIFNRVNMKTAKKENPNMYLSTEEIRKALSLISKEKKGTWSAVENKGNFYITKEAGATFEYIGRIEFTSEVKELAQEMGLSRNKHRRS